MTTQEFTETVLSTRKAYEDGLEDAAALVEKEAASHWQFYAPDRLLPDRLQALARKIREIKNGTGE